MAGKAELDAALATLTSTITAETTTVQTEVGNVVSIITEMTGAFNRLLQKIAFGSPDIQAEVDQITALNKTLTDANESLSKSNDSLVSAIAQAKVEGQ